VISKPWTLAWPRQDGMQEPLSQRVQRALTDTPDPWPLWELQLLRNELDARIAAAQQRSRPWNASLGVR